MPAIHESLQCLSDRLPELEWKLSTLGTAFHPSRLPTRLFRNRLELTPETCIDEIKADIHALKRQENPRSAHYLVARVSEKINVLVRLCQIHTKKPVVERQAMFGVRAISTRLQWLETLQEDITRLAMQKQALLLALQTRTSESRMDAQLSLQAEVGEIDRRLTLAKETLERATRW